MRATSVRITTGATGSTTATARAPSRTRIVRLVRATALSMIGVSTGSSGTDSTRIIKIAAARSTATAPKARLQPMPVRADSQTRTPSPPIVDGRTWLNSRPIIRKEKASRNAMATPSSARIIRQRQAPMGNWAHWASTAAMPKTGSMRAIWASTASRSTSENTQASRPRVTQTFSPVFR